MAAGPRSRSSRCAGANTINAPRAIARTTRKSVWTRSPSHQETAMAHKKAGGSSRNGRDSQSKRLGLKAFGGELVNAGSILVRQRGTVFHPGMNVGIGKDHTLFATATGHVKYSEHGPKNKSTVSIEPAKQ